MRFSPNLFLGVAFVLFLVALLPLALLTPVDDPPLPQLPQKTTETVATRSAPDVTRLALPWQSQPVRAMPSPPARPAPVPAPTDSTSVRYLGTLTGEEEVKTYLFKFVPNGTVLTLVEGRELQGWTLKQVTAQQFSLQGPGGLYVVSR